MFLESRFGSRDPLLGILSRILEDLFEDPFEKKKAFFFQNLNIDRKARITSPLQLKRSC